MKIIISCSPSVVQEQNPDLELDLDLELLPIVRCDTIVTS